MAISWQLIVGLSFILANRGDGDPPPLDQVATGDLEIARALDDYHHHWILTGQPTTASRWKPVREGARDRIDALKSGKLSGGQECTVSTTAIGPFSISFWWKASTERNNDELVFQIDGKERANISGIEDWTQVVQEVGAGPHQISWTYRKDGSIDNGDDAGWIDGVSITDRKESPVEVAKPDRNAASWPNWSVSAPALPDRRYQLWAKEDGLDWKPGSDEAKPSQGDRIEFFEPEFKAKKRQYRITLVEPPTFTKLPENELNAILGQPFAIEIETHPGRGPAGPLEAVRCRWFFLPAKADPAMVPVELDRQEGSSWKVPKVVPATEGTYSVKIVNSVGSEETSPRFHVSVRIPPTNARITNGPSLICIDRFGEVTLKVAADGDPNSFRYRWFHNEVEIQEATGPEFKISKFDGNHVGEYYAEVMNDWGLAKSGTVTLKVIGIVDMGRSLKDGKLVAYQGDLVSLAIKPTGDPPFSYRWHRQGEPISDSDRAVLEVDTRTSGTWGYRVYVNNPAKVGAVSKEVELSVHALGPGRVARLNLDLIPVPAGLFRMGSPTGEGFDDERPVREIQISRGFWMGATEITRAQWDLVFPEAGRPEKEDGRLPRSASHVEAVRFCQELTRIERAEGSLDSTLEYGLPTEAEWEYAARRAGMAPDLAAEAWFHDPQHANESSGLRPVATKQPNQAGFFDLLGNAWEWTDDVYLPYDSKAIADPLVVGSADALRVLRGGSVKMSAAGVRAGKRYSDPPETRREDYGFRIVKRRVGRVEQPIFLNQIEDQPMKGVPR